MAYSLHNTVKWYNTNTRIDLNFKRQLRYVIIHK